MMVEQVVEQVVEKTTDMWVLPGMAATVAEESRRQWTLSMLEKERRRMLTKSVEKNKTGD